MKTFYNLVVNTMVAATTTNFLWFALTFWAYLETRSVLATSVIGGSYMLFAAVSGLYLGSYDDHHRKKTAMMVAAIGSLVAFGLAALMYLAVPSAQLLNLSGWEFWLFVILILVGAVISNMRSIALATTVTMLVPEDRRDRANGLVGTANGVSFAITSVFSGLAIGFLGMGWALGITVGLIALAALHLATIKFTESQPAEAHTDTSAEKPGRLDLRGTLAVIMGVPGLMALILFATFNNFLGGVYMSLLDPYGLSLVSVEVWGIVWGIVSLGFIIGGLAVAKKGLGRSPLRTLFIANAIIWVICIIFPLKSSIVLLTIGMFLYMCFIPVIEAAEQTIIQKVVPFKRQGRVFGFAQSLESAASPITAFLIGPIAQFWVIPYMTTGSGATALNGWFGSGPDRAMALIFVVAGIIGLIVTLMAMTSRSYRLLSQYKPS